MIARFLSYKYLILVSSLLTFYFLFSCTPDWIDSYTIPSKNNIISSLPISPSPIQKSINEPESKDSIRHLKLLFTGDIMGHTPQIRAAEIKKNKTYDYKPSFEYVAPIIRAADLAIGNLEVTLPGRPPYRGYPIFRSPDDLAKDLKWAGFDVLVTANNHSNDSGKEGVLNTIKTLKTLGFHQTGTFKNPTERDLFYPLILNKNGIKIALLNYTYGTNDIPTTPPTIVNKINWHTIKRDLEKAKKRSPDCIIVMVHWGAEYQLIENQKQRKLADWLARQGVHIVVGAHPHVVQPVIEKVVKKEENNQIHKSLIAYSLGNFVSNQNKKNTDGGIILEVDITKNIRQDSAYIADTHFIPVWRYIQETNQNDIYRVLPISVIESNKRSFINLPSTDKEEMLDFLRVTRSRLKHNGAKERRITVKDITPLKKMAQK